MKKIILILFTFIVLIGCNKSKNGTIKVGVILPLTGSAAVWGKNAKMGIDLALSEIKKKNTLNKRKIDLIYQDSKSKAIDAVTALQKMISIDHVPIVIGDIASSSVLAMAPIAEKNKVVLLSPGASSPKISFAGDFIFRNWQSDALEGKIDAKFAFDSLKVKTVCVLYVNNGYGAGLKEYFVKTFKSMGGRVLSIESFDQGATDMSSQLNKIKLLNPDLIYMPSYPNEMITILIQAKELNLNIQFLSTQAFDDPTILKIAKDAANGVIFSIPVPPDTSMHIVKAFTQNYLKTFHKAPGVCSNTGYDALYLIAIAISKGATSGVDFKNFLYSVKNYYGAAGITTFDSKGDVIKPFTFMKVMNNKFVLYE